MQKEGRVGAEARALLQPVYLNVTQKAECDDVGRNFVNTDVRVDTVEREYL
jgi:hypothetical protein